MAVVQSARDVNMAPTVAPQGNSASPATWTYIWVGVAFLTIIGFHIKVFGQAVPPGAHFPR
jgi:hypothetical protein